MGMFTVVNSGLIEEDQKSYWDRKLLIPVPPTDFIMYNKAISAPLLFCSDMHLGEVHCFRNVDYLTPVAL